MMKEGLFSRDDLYYRPLQCRRRSRIKKKKKKKNKTPKKKITKKKTATLPRTVPATIFATHFSASAIYVFHFPFQSVHNSFQSAAYNAMFGSKGSKFFLVSRRAFRECFVRPSCTGPGNVRENSSKYAKSRSRPDE